METDGKVVFCVKMLIFTGAVECDSLENNMKAGYEKPFLISTVLDHKESGSIYLFFRNVMC